MTRRLASLTSLSLLFALPACGDDSAGSESASGTAGESTASSTAGEPATTGSGATQGASGSEGDSESTTAGPSTTSTGSTSSSSSDPGVTSGPKLDVGAIPDAGTQSCEAKCGNTDWSYVWIANSGEHTISKLDTRDVVEVGRYYTRPDKLGNPSRTSVSIDGKAVAVANRSGGVTKIWAREEFCEDKNQNGVIETSSGKDDVLEFDEEECIAWFTDFPEATTQRPIAWTSGVFNEETCEYDDQKIWSASGNGLTDDYPPCEGSPGIFVYLLNGDDGAVEETLHLADVSCGSSFGPYGGAVDYNNDLWMYIWATGTVVHVEFETYDYEVISGGSYGITVDSKGRPWVGDYPRRYDPDLGLWEQPMNNLPGAGGAGIAEDHLGRMWTATQGGVGWVHMDTLTVGDTVPLPEGNGIYRGVGVDVDGYIWAVRLGGTTAHRIDPESYEIATYDGLNSPYTYSDMAGGQLNTVICNPPPG